MSIEALNLNYSNLSPEIINSNVLPYYNLQDSEISVIKFKNSDKQRAVYKIDHNNKSYCLKKVYYDIKDLLYVYSSIEWLYRNNIRVPKLLPTIDNNRFVFRTLRFMYRRGIAQIYLIHVVYIIFLYFSAAEINAYRGIVSDL